MLGLRLGPAERGAGPPKLAAPSSTLGRRPGLGRAPRWAAGLGRPTLKVWPAVSVSVSLTHDQSAGSVEGDQFHVYITDTLERVTLD